MSLRFKFNLILIVLALIGIGISGVVSYSIQKKHAQEEMLETARVLMESAIAIRNYTVKEIRPLLHELESDRFLAQTVPAYSALRYIDALQKQHPGYVYKESALNPTNLANKATDWETDIINVFRSEPSKEMIGIRETPIGKSLYLSRPIKITDAKCLACHSTPEAAPVSMIERYGSEHGFGWQLNETIGAQIVSVPLDFALERARTEFYLFMLVIVSAFVVISVAMNILLNIFVIKPVMLMAANADKVSMGTLDQAELELNGEDEISSLNRSFNRMQRSLKNALSMLTK